MCRGGHAGGRLSPRCRSHGHDDARSGLAAKSVSPLCRTGPSGLRHRGVFHWRGRASPRRDAHQGGDLHQLHPRSSGLPRLHGGLLAGESRVVCLAGPSGRRGQHGRSQGRQHRARPGWHWRRPVDRFHSGSRPPAGQRCGLRRAGFEFHRRRGPRDAPAADRSCRPVQRVQPLGRSGCHARGGGAVGRSGSGLQRAAARAGAHGLPFAAGETAGRRGLRPYAGCA